jgi:hypothetical protein
VENPVEILNAEKKTATGRDLPATAVVLYYSISERGFLKKKKLIDIGLRLRFSWDNAILFLDGFFPMNRDKDIGCFLRERILVNQLVSKVVSPKNRCKSIYALFTEYGFYLPYRNPTFCCIAFFLIQAAVLPSLLFSCQKITR